MALLEHVAGGPGHERVKERLVVVEGGEQEARYVGGARADLSTRRDAVAVRQHDVENGDIGAGGGHAVERFPRGRRLTDDRKVGLGLQEGGHAAPDEFMVLDDEDPNSPIRPVPLGAGGLIHRCRPYSSRARYA